MMLPGECGLGCSPGAAVPCARWRTGVDGQSWCPKSLCTPNGASLMLLVDRVRLCRTSSSHVLPQRAPCTPGRCPG